MNKEDKIWDYSIDEIVRGYADIGESFVCVMCGKEFEKGNIYQVDGRLYDAYGMVKWHTGCEHGLTVDHLLQYNGSMTGLSEIQKQVLIYMSEGKSDKEISGTLGITASTVRNHRFKLREKEKQAKLFLALMQSLEEKTNSRISESDTGNLEELHSTAVMVDERYAITDAEREKVLKIYMDENGAIRQFPPKVKKKIIILREVIKNFRQDVQYTEKDVNIILKRIYESDYPSLRRALIEYGFMERCTDGSVYRVKE